MKTEYGTITLYNAKSGCEQDFHFELPKRRSDGTLQTHSSFKVVVTALSKLNAQKQRIFYLKEASPLFPLAAVWDDKAKDMGAEAKKKMNALVEKEEKALKALAAKEVAKKRTK